MHHPAPNKPLIQKTLLSKLHCLVLPAKGRYCRTGFLPHYQHCYDFWHHALKKALLEEKNIELAKHLSSDGFIEQDQGFFLLDKDQPIGMFMCRWIDLSIKPNRELSAFSTCYPVSTQQQIISQGHDIVMTMGQLAIAHAWRQRQAGFGLSDILFDFIIREFLNSRATLLLTTTRNNRKTNELVMRRGAKKMEDNGLAYGVPSDVMVLDKKDIQPFTPQELADQAAKLWHNRTNGWVKMPLYFKEENYEGAIT